MSGYAWREKHLLVPAVYVILRKGDEVLLLQRANTGYQDGNYSLPAGHLDGGEPAITAAIREAKEEVGVDIDPQNLKLVHTQHRVAESRDHERVSFYFEATTWGGEPRNAEPDKCTEIRWASLDDLPANIVPELREMFPHYREGNVYGHFGF